MPKVVLSAMPSTARHVPSTARQAASYHRWPVRCISNDLLTPKATSMSRKVVYSKPNIRGVENVTPRPLREPRLPVIVTTKTSSMVEKTPQRVPKSRVFVPRGKGGLVKLPTIEKSSESSVVVDSSESPELLFCHKCGDFVPTDHNGKHHKPAVPPLALASIVDKSSERFASGSRISMSRLSTGRSTRRVKVLMSRRLVERKQQLA